MNCKILATCISSHLHCKASSIVLAFQNLHLFPHKRWEMSTARSFSTNPNTSFQSQYSQLGSPMLSIHSYPLLRRREPLHWSPQGISSDQTIALKQQQYKRHIPHAVIEIRRAGILYGRLIFPHPWYVLLSPDPSIDFKYVWVDH